MGVDAKRGRFPICPEMSRLVPICLFPFLGPGTGTKEDKRGQNGTFRDKLGNAPIYQKRGEYGFGEYGFKHRTQ